MTASTADFPPLLRRRALLGLLLTTPLAAAGCTTASGAGQRYAPLASLTSTAATATSSEATSEATGAATPAMTTRLPMASSTAQATASTRSVVTAASTEPPPVSQQHAPFVPSPSAPPAPQRATGTTGAPDAPSLRLAYVREHDLYVRDEAGTITRLTSDGVSANPWWTNDGRSLFFTKTPTGQPAQVWRWQSGTAVRQMRQGLWSPDGTAVAWQTPLAPDQLNTTGVWVEQDGQSRQTAPAEPNFGWQPLAWSLDSRRLALARFSLLGGSQPGSYRPNPPHEGPATLWLATAPFSSARNKLSLPNDGQGQPGWPDAIIRSPNGGYLAVGVGPDQACQSCRADGVPFSAIPVAGGAPMLLESALEHGALAWAPNGDWLVLSGPLGRETYDKKRLTRFNVANGPNITRGTRADLANDAAWSDLNPAIAPDGGQIAFARGHSQQSGDGTVIAITSRRIWAMRADGRAPAQLTNATGWTDEYPVWSPDGQWLIFVRWRPQTSKIVPVATIWAVRPDGTLAHQLVGAIGAASDYASGFGYYGQFPWSSLFAVAPVAHPPIAVRIP